MTEREALEIVARMLESGQLNYVKMVSGRFYTHAPAPRFSMDASNGPDTHCIGGWVAKTLGIEPSEYVERSTGALHTLYYPDIHGRWNIDTKQAARAARNYLDTGDPKWSEIVD